MNIEENINKNGKKYFDINIIKRLIKYAKPFINLLWVSLLLLILVTLLQLIRPVIIGKAIDFFLNGYKVPFIMLDRKTDNSISFKNMNLIRSNINSDIYLKAMIVYINGKYYLFDKLTNDDIKKINEYNFSGYNINKSDISLRINNKNLNAILLSEYDLKILRYYDFKGLIIVTVLFLLLLIFGFIFNYLQVLILQTTGQKIIYSMRHELFEHILKLPFKYFDNNPVGRLVTRMTNDTETINEMYTSVLVNFFKNLFLMIGIVIMMIIINPVLTLLTFIVIPFILIAVYIFRHYARENYRRMRKVLASLNSFLSEHISGMKIIQIFNIEEKKYKEFDGVSEDLKNTYMKEIRIFGIFRPLMFMFYTASVCLVLLFGGNSIIKGTMTFGTLFMFFYYAGLFFDPVQELAEQFNILQSAMASSERIFKLLDEKNNIINDPESIKIDRINGKIEFKNVWFAYNDEDWILKNVSFCINPGETIALVGFTGSGKTTIINLICRFYDIQKGEILIDGINIKNIDIFSLRKNIGLVMQDVFVFTGSIASNIRLKETEISDKDIIDASVFVNADLFIKKYPKKYEEAVSEHGSTLSTGQRQLLSFARTIAFNPSLLVLDEATS